MNFDESSLATVYPDKKSEVDQSILRKQKLFRMEFYQDQQRAWEESQRKKPGDDDQRVKASEKDRE